ncbi:NAD(P)/FAD-dependent oxidoreductase [Litoreibacter roseus]|uniref:Pyridine nucleotide-disulfide oxidoreductase n=1 Tax=Litoreibacter roseus TaxID=2601869 RepID=A0A6N6JFM0_9RHOB|nr:FAD-dependent oxidoreductase [Litoreibacter roseus]GFE64757.1 pyridine nucleotide-disulfide oxidoreductase [Litoreibacter roseus]
MPHVVVVGAGQAGSSLVFKLRNLGYDGDITLIGAEPVPPYQRPPLSKKYLLGEMSKDRLFLRPEALYAEKNITLKLGAPVDLIDTERKVAQVGDEEIPYDKLAITSGLVARALPDACGGGLSNVHVIRTLEDVDAMREPFAKAKNLAIIGGGYIGLEAAAVAAQLGLNVTVVEMTDRILERVACPETSDYFRTLHQNHGVTIREGVSLKHLVGETQVEGALLSDGSTIEADIAITGIGVIPRCAIAERSGLRVENGVRTDIYGQTSDDSIWAAGDCASFPFQGERIRLESVQNAIDQAECVAENMMGAQKEYHPSPWFWSDQYDVKLQIAGLNTGYTHVAVRGEADSGRSHWYYKDETLLAVDAMNDPRAYMIGKRLIEANKHPSMDMIADADTDLKALLAA